TNGMMVGRVLAVGVLEGEAARVWAIIAPHGILELSAIIISGGAGLRLGYAVIDPGDHSRREAIILAAREAIKLMFGIAPIFLVAGLIEGTISPIAVGLFAGNFPRIIFGAATGIILAGYLLLGDRWLGRISLGRRSRSAPPTRAVVPSAPSTD
ncbi:MAG: stage II sporulation protein M, partial [Candidatus Zipacnadales bacterium]